MVRAVPSHLPWRRYPSHLPRRDIPAQRPLLLPHRVPCPRACPIRCLGPAPAPIRRPGAGPAPRLGRFTSATSNSLAENLVQPATTALSARDFDIKSATGVGAASQRGDGGTARVRGAGSGWCRGLVRGGTARVRVVPGRGCGAPEAGEVTERVVGGISRWWDQSRAVSRSVRTVKSTAARHALGWVKPSSAPASPRVRTPGSNTAPAERAVARCNE